MECKKLNNAVFVGGKEKEFFPYIRKSFCINEKIKSATLYISALGFCEVYINNSKITDDLYITPLSEYNPQPLEDNPTLKADMYFTDTLDYTIYVSKFDVTKFISENNAIGIILAGGWYRSGKDKHNNYRNFGNIKVCFNIEIELVNGKKINVVSDSDCKIKESFLTKAGIFHEEQDERKEILDFSTFDYNDKDWDNVTLYPSPDSKYLLNDCPPNRIVDYIIPKLIKTTDNEKIYDVGVNITGYPIIVGKSNSGDEIKCVMGETLNEDGLVDEFHSYSQNSTFISSGKDCHYIRFTWHGFRYFSISTSGDINDLRVDKCALVRADIKNTSSFSCSDDIINFIYDAYVRSQLENFQCGVPTDCPQIERKGYTGDGQLLCALGMGLFSSQKLYKKWLNDIADVQDRKTGYVHNTAPCFIGCSGGVGGWSVAIINVPYTYYLIYGDRDVLTTYYPRMLDYVKFMNNELVDDLVVVHTRTGCRLGDWSGPYKPYLPEPFVNSCLYVEALEKLKGIAFACGYERDIDTFNVLINKIKNAINDKFFDSFSGNYCENVQGANAFAINIRLGDDRTLANLNEYYNKTGEYDTGIFGTDILTRVLFNKGFEKTAIKLLTSHNDVSFYSWMKQGATTLFESWQNTRSLNHPMFGSVVRYFFQYILGIRQSMGCGYENIVINPVCTDIINSAKGKINTVKGDISVCYSKNGDKIDFVIDIPKKVKALFKLKDKYINLVAGENKFSFGV